jgi:hypothetical protein
MNAEHCDFFLLLCVLIYLYWNYQVWDEIDSKHLASRAFLRETDPELMAEQDRIVREKALSHKYKTIADYRNRYKISGICAQEIVESILKDEPKAQS